MIVVDTNILLSFFREDSVTKQLIKAFPTGILAPETAEKELVALQHKLQQWNITEKQFKKGMQALRKHVDFISSEECSKFLAEAKQLAQDKSDAAFLALCLAKHCPLWSNDNQLRKQKTVSVLTTADIIDSLA